MVPNEIPSRRSFFTFNDFNLQVKLVGAFAYIHQKAIAFVPKKKKGEGRVFFFFPSELLFSPYEALVAHYKMAPNKSLNPTYLFLVGVILMNVTIKQFSLFFSSSLVYIFFFILFFVIYNIKSASWSHMNTAWPQRLPPSISKKPFPSYNSPLDRKQGVASNCDALTQDTKWPASWPKFDFFWLKLWSDPEFCTYKCSAQISLNFTSTVQRQKRCKVRRTQRVNSTLHCTIRCLDRQIGFDFRGIQQFRRNP